MYEKTFTLQERVLLLDSTISVAKVISYMEGWIATESVSTHILELSSYAPYIDLYNKATYPVLSHREGYTGYLSIAPLPRGGNYRQMSRCPNEKLLGTALDED